VLFTFPTGCPVATMHKYANGQLRHPRRQSVPKSGRSTVLFVTCQLIHS
jgi:hypothetical protein